MNIVRSDIVLNDNLEITDIIPRDCNDGSFFIKESAYTDEFIYADVSKVIETLLNNQYDVYVSKIPGGISIEYNHKLNRIEHKWLTEDEVDLVGSDRFSIVKDKKVKV